MEKLREFIKTELFADDFDNSDSLLDKGIIDSTGVLSIVQYIESEYNIKVENDEITPENLDSVDKIMAYIGRKV